MLYIIPLVVTVLWLLLLAFFASGEIMVMALDPLRLETEASRGNRRARILRYLRRDPQRFLTTMLIGNNIASMSLAAYFTSLCISLLHERGSLTIESATLFSAVTMVVVQTLFGELIPKTLAAVSSQRQSERLALPLLWTQRLFTPFSWLLESAIRPLVRLLTGGRTAMESHVRIADLQTALRLAHLGGHLNITDAAVATEALDFSRKTLGDSMTPRVDVAAMPDSATVGEALALMGSTGFSRLPVFRGNLDTIVGVLFLKDLVQLSLSAAEAGRDPNDLWAREAITPLMRQPAFFPEGKSIVETLSEMQKLRVHLAVVVDEHGGTAGVVTLEDILEELVGDIRDETDSDHSADVIQRGEGYAIVTGRARLDTLPELDGVDVHGAEANTVGGLMMELMGRPAAAGDSVTLDGLRLTALKVLRTQVKLVRIEKIA